MAVRIESFLVLEQSLARRLHNSWRRTAAGATREIIEAVQSGDFVEAVSLCDQLSLAESAERNRKFAEFIGMQAVLFGASRVTNGEPRRTSFMAKERPEEVQRGADILVQMLSANGTETLCRDAQSVLSREQADQQEAHVQKQATAGFVQGFASFVDKSGNAFIDLGSSLHTSRLASWGFTVEADIRGITTYQVNEQLDGRTCPICRSMHGRTFEVGPARRKLEGWLGADDPQEFKSLAPWPKQDAASVKNLQGMSSADIQRNGWDTPPYHPLCRGVLVEAGTVRPVEQVEIPVLPPAQPGPRAVRVTPAAIAAVLLPPDPDPTN